MTGVPLSVIETPYVKQIGTKAGPVARLLLQNARTRHWMRFLYGLASIRQLKRSATRGLTSKDYWQAGKSVRGIDKVEGAGDIVRRFKDFVEGLP